MKNWAMDIIIALQNAGQDLSNQAKDAVHAISRTMEKEVNEHIRTSIEAGVARAREAETRTAKRASEN